MQPRRKRESAKLTSRQRSILLYGHSAMKTETGRGFVMDSNEELAAWYEHRAALLAASGECRPAACFAFELCEESPRWIRDVKALMRNGLFAGKPALVELNAPMLSAYRALDLNSQFETVEGIRALELLLPTLEELLREFSHAEAWHRFRNRPALARILCETQQLWSSEHDT